jgi:hypothetical protein
MIMGHHGPTIRFMCLIQCLILNGHLYLSVVGLDVNLKPDTCLKNGLRAQFERNNQHNGGEGGLI